MYLIDISGYAAATGQPSLTASTFTEEM